MKKKKEQSQILTKAMYVQFLEYGWLFVYYCVLEDSKYAVNFLFGSFFLQNHRTKGYVILGRDCPNLAHLFLKRNLGHYEN